MTEWQKNALRLYYEEKKKINEVAAAVGRTRQTVSVFLRSIPEWNDEQQSRKEDSKKKRAKYKRLWDFHNRSQSDISESVNRDHIQAVAELSREKYR